MLVSPAFVSLEHCLAQPLLEFFRRHPFRRNHRIALFIQLIDMLDQTEGFDLLKNFSVCPRIFVLFKTHIILSWPIT